MCCLWYMGSPIYGFNQVDSVSQSFSQVALLLIMDCMQMGRVNPSLGGLEVGVLTILLEDGTLPRVDVLSGLTCNTKSTTFLVDQRSEEQHMSDTP
jgi:hypothetical protein